MHLSLTRRQYYALCTMVLLSPLLHLVPRKTAEEAGCGGWLSGATALVPLLLFAALLEGILRRGRPGEGIGEITLPALVLLCAAAVGAGALLLAQNAFDTDALQTNVVPRLNLALLGLGTVGTYLTGRARKTI